MVRVFSAYQFAGQNILRVNDEIRVACAIDSDHLILAKGTHLIEICSLNTTNDDLESDNEIRNLYSFPTVDEVIEMIYCEYGKLCESINFAFKS